MNADREQKRYDATATRKAKARREGNGARSTEIGGIAAFAAGAAATIAIVPLIGNSAVGVLREASGMREALRLPAALWCIGMAALVPALAAAFAATGAGLAQSGGLHVRAVSVNFTHLNPAAGLKRMFGGEAIVGAARATLAFACAGAVMLPLAFTVVGQALTLAGPLQFAPLVRAAAEHAILSALAVGACFACVDYALARRRWLRDIKMTHEEMKRDQKENDGDPHTRSRRKQLHRSLVRGSIARTREASFVVVNPTHIAIAIRYAPPEVGVPEILVRAADATALTVKSIASEYAIPIVENVPLARALYAMGEAGSPIPNHTFVAVARVIAELTRAGALA